MCTLERPDSGIALASAVEFLAVVTHPASDGGPSTPEQARGFLAALADGGGAMVWFPRHRFRERLCQLATDLDVGGSRTFDLQIALTAFDNGASEIWTHHRRFGAFPGLRVHDPPGRA